MSVMGATRIGGGDSGLGECGAVLRSESSAPHGCTGGETGDGEIGGETGTADGSFIVVGASELGGGGAVTASWMLGASLDARRRRVERVIEHMMHMHDRPSGRAACSR